MSLQLQHPAHGLIVIPRREIQLASYSTMLLRWISHQLTAQSLLMTSADYEAMSLYADVWRIFDSGDPELWDLHLRVMLGINMAGVINAEGVVARYAHDILASMSSCRHAGECVTRLVLWTRERLGSDEWVADAVTRAQRGDLGIRWP